MDNILDVADFCNTQAEYYRKKASWKANRPEQTDRFTKLADKFTKCEHILRSANNSELDKDTDLFAIDPFDLAGLPDELVDELSISRADQDDAQVIQIFRIAKRPLNINEVMVGIYRKFGVSHKRPGLSARLYRMASRGDLINPEKGTYALPPVIILKESPPKAG